MDKLQIREIIEDIYTTALIRLVRLLLNEDIFVTQTSMNDLLLTLAEKITMNEKI